MMSESSDIAQIIVGLFFLGCVLVLTRIGISWRLKRASTSIIEDLKTAGAFNISSAIELPYAKSHLFKIGLRDFRPKALDGLIRERIVGVTQDEKYYFIITHPDIAG